MKYPNGYMHYVCSISLFDCHQHRLFEDNSSVVLFSSHVICRSDGWGCGWDSHAARDTENNPGHAWSGVSRLHLIGSEDYTSTGVHFKHGIVTWHEMMIHQNDQSWQVSVWIYFSFSLSLFSRRNWMSCSFNKKNTSCHRHSWITESSITVFYWQTRL